MTQRKVVGEETVCPECGDALRMDINIGDGYKHDVCLDCGFKRKKNSAGQLVDKLGEVIELEQEDEKV